MRPVSRLCGAHRLAVDPEVSQPMDNSKWEGPCRGVSPTSDASITRAYKRELYELTWCRAANHFAGEGLAEGEPSWHGTDSAMKFFDKMGRKNLKSALRKIVAGGAAVGECFARNTGCNRCGCPVESTKHRWHETAVSVRFG